MDSGLSAFATLRPSPGMTNLAPYSPLSSQPNFSRALRAISGLGVLVGGNLSGQGNGGEASITASEWVKLPGARFSGGSRGSAGESHEPVMKWIDSIGSVRVSMAHRR